MDLHDRVSALILAGLSPNQAFSLFQEQEKTKQEQEKTKQKELDLELAKQKNASMYTFCFTFFMRDSQQNKKY